MNLLSIIRISYIAFTLYIFLLVDVTSLSMIDLLPAVLIMWFVYYIFTLGYKSCSRSVRTINLSYQVKIVSCNNYIIKYHILTLSILSIFASILAAKFYTGQSPLSILTGLIDNNRSLYAEYQYYVEINNISSFTIYKVPFILMMFYVKFVLFYFGISLCLCKKSIDLIEKTSLFFAITAHIYFGLARGTNFELFEIVLLFIYITLSRISAAKTSSKTLINFISIFSVIGIMIYLFYNRIASRGYVFDFLTRTEFTYNPQGEISTFSPGIAFVTILLYDYFGFGFYYVSYFANHIWLASVRDLIFGMIPYGYYSHTNKTISDMVGEKIKIYARWHPDIIFNINTIGFLGTIFLFFLLGYFTRYIERENIPTIVHLTKFIVFVQMISLPIGNFVFISSSSTLIVVLIISVWVWEIIFKKKNHLHCKVNG